VIDLIVLNHRLTGLDGKTAYLSDYLGAPFVVIFLRHLH
jgi:hypothetical protein